MKNLSSHAILIILQLMEYRIYNCKTAFQIEQIPDEPIQILLCIDSEAFNLYYSP